MKFLNKKAVSSPSDLTPNEREEALKVKEWVEVLDRIHAPQWANREKIDPAEESSAVEIAHFRQRFVTWSRLFPKRAQAVVYEFMEGYGPGKDRLDVPFSISIAGQEDAQKEARNRFEERLCLLKALQNCIDSSVPLVPPDSLLNLPSLSPRVEIMVQDTLRSQVAWLTKEGWEGKPILRSHEAAVRLLNLFQNHAAPIPDPKEQVKLAAFLLAETALTQAQMSRRPFSKKIAETHAVWHRKVVHGVLRVFNSHLAAEKEEMRAATHFYLTDSTDQALARRGLAWLNQEAKAVESKETKKRIAGPFRRNYSMPSAEMAPSLNHVV